MRAILVGVLLLASGAQLRAETMPPMPAVACDAALPFRGTAAGLPLAVRVRRSPMGGHAVQRLPASRVGAPVAASQGAVAPLPRAAAEEPEATLRPAFHLCVTEPGTLRAVLYRT